MSVHKYEVVKEYVYSVDGLSENVKARIIKSSRTDKMKWECSHHYCESNGQAAYESNHETECIESSESELDGYMSNFNADTAKKNIEY